MTDQRTLKLTIEYDGTDFHGWQRQPGERTVEGAIEEALAGLVPGGAGIQGASRTDRGVHALGQVASARVHSPIPTARFARALNGRLPPDVRVRRVEEAPSDFNARFSAAAKHYRYWIDRRDIPGVFTCRYALHAPGPLDLDAMSEAGACFLGEHDFAAYRSAGGAPGESVRTIHAVRVAADGSGDLLAIDVAGRSFLYKMVRTMVGTLLEVGRGTRTRARVLESLLPGASRSAAGPTAPAHGLVLISVSYPGRGSNAGSHPALNHALCSPILPLPNSPSRGVS